MKVSSKSVAVVCTTGMATKQFRDASTVHYWAGLKDGRYSDKTLLHLMNTSEEFQNARKRISSVDILMIDEISMLSMKVFEQLEFICRNVRNSKKRFGGIQVIASGSFKQLPPVPNYIYNDHGDFCFNSILWPEAFPHHVHLTEVIRQNELDLINVVNTLEDGSGTTETDTFMHSLQREILVPQGKTLTRLFSLNDDVRLCNARYLRDMPGNAVKYVSTDEGKPLIFNLINSQKEVSMYSCFI